MKGKPEGKMAKLLGLTTSSSKFANNYHRGIFILGVLHAPSFLPLLLVLWPRNFYHPCKNKGVSGFLAQRCYSSSEEMETKLNLVLQFKNISQMQANKNFPGSSWFFMVCKANCCSRLWLWKPWGVQRPCHKTWALPSSSSSGVIFILNTPRKWYLDPDSKYLLWMKNIGCPQFT